MHFPTVYRKQEQDTLPIVEEDTQRNAQRKMPVEEEERKDSASITPSVAKPSPARTPSTRIQEAKRTPSQMTSQPHTSRNVSEKTQRPNLQRRRTTARTRYIDMLLGLDHVSPIHNILASLFVWILLAGYIVFPATFNKLQNDDLDNKADTRIEKHALNTVRNVPLLYVAAFACGLGVTGCLWLWWQHRKNYVWVINRIFMPALLNSLAGLVSTLVNVYSAQDGTFCHVHRAYYVKGVTNRWLIRSIFRYGKGYGRCDCGVLGCCGWFVSAL
jgi:hypothetical protein